MAHPAEKKNAVRHSYVTELLALSVAAIKHNVADGTARRRSEGTAGEFTTDFIEEFTIQVNETFELLKSPEGAALPLDQRTKILSSLTDMMSKVMKVSGGNKRLEKRTIATEVLKILAKFVSTKYPEFAPEFVEILTAFGPKLDTELDD